MQTSPFWRADRREDSASQDLAEEGKARQCPALNLQGRRRYTRAAQGDEVSIPMEHRPSNASHSNGLRNRACLKLAFAFSGKLPFNAIAPERQCNAAFSGNKLAVRDLADAAI
jgi:hypothetical protein